MLSEKEYEDLTLKLLNIQNHKCFICGEAIDLKLHSTNIDHITPFSKQGKDSEENFAATHESCNKSKQDLTLNCKNSSQTEENTRRNFDKWKQICVSKTSFKAL